MTRASTVEPEAAESRHVADLRAVHKQLDALDKSFRAAAEGLAATFPEERDRVTKRMYTREEVLRVQPQVARFSEYVLLLHDVVNAVDHALTVATVDPED